MSRQELANFIVISLGGLLPLHPHEANSFKHKAMPWAVDPLRARPCETLAARYVRVKLQYGCGQGLAIRERCRRRLPSRRVVGDDCARWSTCSRDADVAWSSDEGVDNVGWGFGRGKYRATNHARKDSLTINHTHSLRCAQCTPTSYSSTMKNTACKCCCFGEPRAAFGLQTLRSLRRLALSSHNSLMCRSN